MEEGYVIQKGVDSPTRVKLLRQQTHESPSESEQEDSEFEVSETKNKRQTQTFKQT
jgi:hypothetical protein